ncbi:hypothetical protein H6F61_24140 [Cyanobacteria bacterium FACHB-472]|nr:hypothetical protein [Cyanobacteria bacterium FACHB-472]
MPNIENAPYTTKRSRSLQHFLSATLSGVFTARSQTSTGNLILNRSMTLSLISLICLMRRR